MITVYFDGKCGLCSKEIRYYQRIAPAKIFVWADIATNPAPLAAHNIEQADALRRLHVLDDSGQWHIGVAAFLAIWRHLPLWKWLAPLVALPGIYHLAEFAYGRFADYRFARLPHCQISTE